MAGEQKFSRYLVRTLVLFQAVSLALVVGILYGILSRSMLEEFRHAFHYRATEAGLALQDRLDRLEGRLRSISGDNTVRVGLMLGVRSQLGETLEKQYPSGDGAFFFLQEEGEQGFLPPLPDRFAGLTPLLLEMRAAEGLSKRLLPHAGDDPGFSLFSIPVRRKDDRVGTAYLVHDLSADNTFWQRIGQESPSGLFFQRGNELLHLRTGDRKALAPAEPGINGDEPVRLQRSDGPGEAVISLKNFPGLVYMGSHTPLEKQKRSLILILAVLCAAVFSLTYVMAFYIARKVSNPLENMADQAIGLAGRPSASVISEAELQHVEFRKLGRAFNALLESLMETQDKLEKRADELEISRRRYRNLIESSPVGILSLDPDCRILLANRAVQEMTGRGEEELCSMNLKDLIHPDETERFRETWEAGLERNLLETSETRWRGADHAAIWVELRGIHLDESGRRSILLSAMDISGRKRAEEERRVLEERLRHSEKMEAIGTLAGGVAHDLNNILSGIVSYPDMILMNLPEDSQLRKPILIMQKSGKKAAAIVQDLLTLARRGVANKEPVDLNRIVLEYTASPEHAKLLAQYPYVQLREDLAEGLPRVMGSPAHLSKTLMNLVLNAVESISEGGTVRISTEKAHFSAGMKRYGEMPDGDYVVLRVSDTGSGIAPGDINRIFEPFFSRKRLGRSGTGLGMAVVWGTVNDHDGHIDVESTPGSGTTFTLCFPPGTTETLGKGRKPVPEDYRGDGESVLVVDDVEEQRVIAREILAGLGYEVFVASSGEEAVSFMNEHRADVLLLDMIMNPGIDGLETYRRVLRIHPGQKAILASGYSETERVKEAQRLGAGAYVRKPYLIEQIGLAIRAELARKV